MTYAQCGHFDFDEMSDDEIVKNAFVLQGRTEASGDTKLICCKDCFTKALARNPMKFRKKPVVVEAIQWTGHNPNELAEFMGCGYPKIVENRRVRIKTLEGAVYADPLDWIIKGIANEFYPCKPEIFEKTYEAVV